MNDSRYGIWCWHNLSHHAGCDPPAAGSSIRPRFLYFFLIWFGFYLDGQPKVDIPRAIPRSSEESSSSSDHLSKLPSSARAFGAFLQSGQLHFLWVSSPPLCLLLNWQSPQSSDTLETTFSLWGGCTLPPRCSLGADIKLLSNGNSFPFYPLCSHFARGFLGTALGEDSFCSQETVHYVSISTSPPNLSKPQLLMQEGWVGAVSATCS